MAKTWVLDTETKGTGAHISPLDSRGNGAEVEQDLAVVTLERPPRAGKVPEPLGPLRFKLVDIRSGRVLAQDIDARGMVDLLEGTGSVVDLRIYVWMRTRKRWRLLTLEEQKALWGLRGREPSTASAR
jgi:hypothetical protein